VNPSILVVDDHADTVDIFVQNLQSAGFEARGTTSPNEALNLALTEHPDVLVVDICMPELDGRELAALVRAYAKTRNIHLVAVSAHVFDFAKQVLPPGGWDACLHKPCDPAMLVETVRSVLASRPLEDRSGARPVLSDSSPPKGDRGER
jgi:two-component system cell cycle response regulator